VQGHLMFLKPRKDFPELKPSLSYFLLVMSEIKTIITFYSRLFAKFVVIFLIVINQRVLKLFRPVVST
jgi:hypothetical protein